MKQADVIPLFKGGNDHLMINYRPISLLLTISKILEKIVYTRVYTFLDSNHQFYNSQYGFRSKHSCKHVVSELLGDVLKSQEKGEHTISVFLDLSKAFDSLEHNTLLKKLEIYGIRGLPLSWFKSYLQDRSLCVKCSTTESDESVYSEYKKVAQNTYGTPQGSCLGPLLFLVFCNNLYLNLLYSSCILFVDDTTVYTSGKNLNLLVCSLEHDLEILNDWFKANKLTLNMNKTICILFKGSSNASPVEVKIDNRTLSFVDYTKFLGIWIDGRLKWDKHVNRLILKLKHNSHLLFQSKQFLMITQRNAFTMRRSLATCIMGKYDIQRRIEEIRNTTKKVYQLY